jgi:hypothetical protein
LTLELPGFPHEIAASVRAVFTAPPHFNDLFTMTERGGDESRQRQRRP